MTAGYDPDGSRCLACDSHHCMGQCQPSFDDAVMGVGPIPYACEQAVAALEAVMAGVCVACAAHPDGECDLCWKQRWERNGFSVTTGVWK